MHANHWSNRTSLRSLPFVLFVALLWILFVAGGAARADVLGQIFVRGAASITIIIALLFGPRPVLGSLKPVWAILIGSCLVGLIQLVPLPPELWQSLPGRQILWQAAVVAGEPQPWRPLSMVPGATINALASLIVPLAILLLVSQFDEGQRQRSLSVVLAIAVASMFVAFFQLSGVTVVNPLGDNDPASVSGLFANRNHFAALVAVGCLLAFVWPTIEARHSGWRGTVALGLIVLFALTILSSGSRAGLLLGIIGIGGGLYLGKSELKRALGRYPQRVRTIAMAAFVLGMVGLALVTYFTDRAVSLNRMLTSDTMQDMRGRALPTVLTMLQTYFPIGAGLGSFASVFRIHEPTALLAPEYLNHVHNDWIEVVVDAGLPGGLLLTAVLLWLVRASWVVWRACTEWPDQIARAGTVVIFIIMSASLVDYPVRTPLLMAVVTIAAYWLASSSAPLPTKGSNL